MDSAVEAEVRAFNRVFEAALAAQDVEGLVALYTDDARLMFAGQPVIRGRTAVEDTMRSWVSAGPVTVRFETDEVIEDGSLVIDIGTAVGPTSRSKYVVLHRRQADGSLRISIDFASSDGTPAATS